MAPAALRCVVKCSVGLEAHVQRELRALRFGRGSRIGRGAVAVDGVALRDVCRANSFLRCADHVLVEACRFRARSFADLELAVRRLAPDIERWLPERDGGGVRRGLKIRVRTDGPGRSRLYMASAISARLLDWLGGSAGAAEPGAPAHLVARVERDAFVVYANSSGAPLHERFWRAEGGKMPLRSSLAAGLLLSAGWPDRGTGVAPASPPRLLDPFCGSGAIPIEAAAMAAGAPPHAGAGGEALRTFAFERWPELDAAEWAAVGDEAAERARAAASFRERAPPITGTDRDAGAVAAAARNAARAGVGDLVDFRRAVVSDLRPGVGGGLVVTNPPWGLRSAGRGASADKRDLYAKFGAVARRELGGWSVAALVASRAHARETRLPLAEALELTVGGRRAWLLAGRVPGGGGG